MKPIKINLNRCRGKCKIAGKQKEKCQAERLIESYVRFSQSEDRMLSQQGISGHVLLR